jgi:four helix bundle protein
MERMSASRFEDLRAWQATWAFKLRVYELLDAGLFRAHAKLEGQLREAAAGAPSQISEGYGRFDPADFGRFVKMARASMMECRNHLQDAVDRGVLDDMLRQELAQQIQDSLKEIGGLLDYLQSPEAKRNAERIRQKRIERYRKRRSKPPEQ